MTACSRSNSFVQCDNTIIILAHKILWLNISLGNTQYRAKLIDVQCRYKTHCYTTPRNRLKGRSVSEVSRNAICKITYRAGHK